jgi:hypothetical protein
MIYFGHKQSSHFVFKQTMYNIIIEAFLLVVGYEHYALELTRYLQQWVKSCLPSMSGWAASLKLGFMLNPTIFITLYKDQIRTAPHPAIPAQLSHFLRAHLFSHNVVSVYLQEGKYRYKKLKTHR